jgi:hypothetical protein
MSILRCFKQHQVLVVNLDIIKLLGKDKVQINCCPSKSEKLNLIKIGLSGLQTYNIY